MRAMMKSKIHRARVTGLSIDYEGSITIDRELMAEADILPYEQVHVLNAHNGARFTTYAIEGERGEMCVNGPAARLAAKGDTVTVISYCHVTDDEAAGFAPKLVYVNKKNAITEVKQGAVAIPF